jgi:hypothetical protein
MHWAAGSEQGVHVSEELAARNAKLVRREVVGGAVLYNYTHAIKDNTFT